MRSHTTRLDEYVPALICGLIAVAEPEQAAECSRNVAAPRPATCRVEVEACEGAEHDPSNDSKPTALCDRRVIPPGFRSLEPPPHRHAHLTRLHGMEVHILNSADRLTW